MDSAHTDAQVTYEERASRFVAEAEHYERRAWLISVARMVAFTLAILLGLLAERTQAWWSIVGAAAALCAFVVLVVMHQRARTWRSWYGELAALNQQGLSRSARDWDALPVRAPARDIADHPYAIDLDLYGRASLSQILGPVGSAAGAAMLDEWLLHPADAATIHARQAAVPELAHRYDIREPLAVHAQRTRAAHAVELDRFLSWAESTGWLGTQHGLRLASWLLPVATWSLLLAHAVGVIARPLWLLPILIAFVVYFTTGVRIRVVFDEAFGREPLFQHYPQMLALLCDAQFDAPLLRSLTAQLTGNGRSADQHIESLARLMHLADLRTSSLHLPVFLLTMWDVHVLAALERWQRAAGPAVRDWLDTLSAAEALSALATLQHDHPDWVFPELVLDGTPYIIAEQLGHPLLREDTRVHNDVTLGPPGSFLLVTGSNMSGKSTLLRALGINAVLAHAGAPVCARSLRLPPLEIYTSMRVQDSLARGVSYFMAELERLKQIVDAADRLRADQSATLLYLIDEMLHGTNTAERRIAARHVIHHLVDSGALGTVTTHDLALADEADIRGTARLVHFQETVTGDSDSAGLSFDYLLRPGLATSTNALKLMKLVGL